MNFIPALLTSSIIGAIVGLIFSSWLTFWLITVIGTLLLMLIKALSGADDAFDFDFGDADFD